LISSADIGAVRRHPIWRPASDQAVRRLLACSGDHRYARGELLLEAGQRAGSYYLLLEGSVRIFYPHQDGKIDVTVKLLSAPAAFGDAESIIRTEWSVSVEALTPARAIVTNAAEYLRLLQSEPAILFRQYWDIARRFAGAMQTEKASNFDELPAKIGAVLLAYAHHFGRAVPGKGVLIHYPLSQDRLAAQVASNRRSVVRTLSTLYRRGLLRRVGRRYLIPDPEKLVASFKARPSRLSLQTDETPWAEVARR
jgi:CRP-like cAMP-binding protein